MVPCVLLVLVWNTSWLSMPTELVLCVHVHSPLIHIQEGESPLMFAAGKGRTDVVEELIRQGGDVNAQNVVRCLRGYYRQWSRRDEVSWRLECVPVG